MSTEPATIAWCMWLDPWKSMTVTSSPCFLKMPARTPTSSGTVADEVGAALPTLRASAPSAGLARATIAATSAAPRARGFIAASSRFYGVTRPPRRGA